MVGKFWVGQIWVPLRPNKRSREELAVLDSELLNRANRFGGGGQLLEERAEEENKQLQAQTKKMKPKAKAKAT